jgi:hypothetical protein
MVLILLFGQLGWAKDVTIIRTVSSSPYPEDIRNQNLIFSNDSNSLMICARVVYVQSNGSNNSFVRIIKTDLDGNLTWNYDYSMFPDPIGTLIPFSITQNNNGDGYVICGSINDDSLSYGNLMKPFTLEIDENGNLNSFNEYTVPLVNRYAAALKITRTPNGHYAMIGMESDQFDSVTSNERMGFLAQLDNSLQVNWWRNFASSYSRNLNPPSIQRYDFASEIISFVPSGGQDEEYFVGGAQTYDSSGGNYAHHSQAWLFDQNGMLLWTIDSIIPGSTLSSATYDLENDVIFAASTSNGGSYAPHSEILEIDANSGNIVSSIMMENGSKKCDCESPGHKWSITNLKLEDDTLYAMGYNYQIYFMDPLDPSPCTKIPNDSFYSPFIAKFYKNDLNSSPLTSGYIWSDNTKNYYWNHPSKLGILGYFYPTSFGDYYSPLVPPVAEQFSGHLAYYPSSFLKLDTLLVFLSFDFATNGPDFNLVLKSNYNSNYCNTLEHDFELKKSIFVQNTSGENYSINWERDSLSLPYADSLIFDLDSCISIIFNYNNNFMPNSDIENSNYFYRARLKDTINEDPSDISIPIKIYKLFDVSGKLIFESLAKDQLTNHMEPHSLYFIFIYSNLHELISVEKFLKIQ